MCFGLYRLHLISTGSPRLWYGERRRESEREGGGREKKRRDDGGRDRWSETKESSDLQLAAGSNQRRGLKRLEGERKKEERKNPETTLPSCFPPASDRPPASAARLISRRRAASQCSCSRKPSIWICSTMHRCKPAFVKNNHATYFTVSVDTFAYVHTHNAAILIYHLLCVHIQPVFCQVLILACFDGEPAAGRQRRTR